MDVKKNRNSWLVRISVLLISIDAASAAVVSGAIPLMKDSFRNVASSTVESTATIPSLSILLFILLSPYVAKKLGTKKTSLIGLGTAFVFGIMPFFLNNIYLILLCRFVYGAGIGLINPLVYTVISHVYVGTEQAEMVGYGSSFTNIVNIILTYTVGFLMPLGWRYSFLAYSVILIIFFLVLLFSPDVELTDEDEKEQEVEEKTNESHADRLGFSAWKYLLFMFFLYIAVLLYQIKYAQILVGNGFGTPQQAAFIMGLINFISIITGLIFGKVFKTFGRSTFLIGLVMILGAYLLIPVTANIYLSAVLVMIMAFGSGFVASYIFYELFQVVSEKVSAKISGYALIAINIGIFCAPYVGGIAASVLHNQSPTLGVVISSVILGCLIVVHLLTISIDKREEKRYAELKK
ncbi:MFS transporter [Lactiplantibacillus xiangfangensis]|uniref:Major facilitator superfamily protein n=1 Tax=Lactiplantibacillus xiangfangensis TaxID=942150 RepID=A0A0R2MDS2_9LACO|nr:MFS transporter [Lactiplantibacillus xiangfangensis]KRO11575.1 major facilitator superfamily protein [Lactiplantibacillus xiangfangensis]